MANPDVKAMAQKEIERLGKLGFAGRKSLPEYHPGFMMVGKVRVDLGDHPEGEEYLFQTSGEGWKHARVKDFEPTVVKAAKLAKMIGPGWTGWVWQNMGWFYRATSPCGRVDVSTAEFQGKRWYTAFLRPASKGRSAGGTYAEHANTPHEAILACERKAIDDFKEAQSMVTPPIERNRPKESKGK